MEMGSLNTADLARLAGLYNLEAYLFETVSARFRTEGTLSPYDFFAIVVWKSNRPKTKIKKGLAAAGKSVEGLMREVHAATTARETAEILLQVPGVGLAMASAILTVCYPDDFTVLDYRSWDSLQGSAVEGLPAHYPHNVDQYLQYCAACRFLAGQAGLSLRDLDRALWAKSWEADLLALIGG
jgi:hypothetical protein